jgi:glutamate synthase (NADPH/NADH) small chain
MWCITTKAFVADDSGNLRAAQCARVEWNMDAQGRWQMAEVPGSEFEIPCELVTLAMGFVHPVHQGMIEQLQEAGLTLDPRGNVAAVTEGDKAYHTDIPGVFSAGDMRRGQSLVVWAIREGRQCARAVDRHLMGHSDLPQ